MDAELETIDGKAVLRFERHFAHPVAKVWRAITDPAELPHWFPAAIETELKPGSKMRFVFPGEAPIDLKMTEGEVLEFDPPKVYAFRWNADVLRFELVPEDDGCRLFFSQTLGGGPIGRLAAARNASGWDTCLATLVARLDGEAPRNDDRKDWLEPTLKYNEKFGLGQGEVIGEKVHFARDLVWQPAGRVWEHLTDGKPVEPGALPPVPATCDRATAGEVTEVEAPRVLEYQWRHGGAPAGRVRWEIVDDGTLGIRIELTQTGPAGFQRDALATWRAHLDKFFVSLFTGGHDRATD